jgi:hypothetical protein
MPRPIHHAVELDIDFATSQPAIGAKAQRFDARLMRSVLRSPVKFGARLGCAFDMLLARTTHTRLHQQCRFQLLQGRLHTMPTIRVFFRFDRGSGV